MAVLSLAKQLGVLAVKTFGDTIANGLKEARCPSMFRQLAINLAQTNHRITTRMQRHLHGFASDAPIPPLDEERAVQAAALLLAELSVYTVAGAAAVFQVRSIISESMKEERRRQDLQAIKTELASMLEFHVKKFDRIGKQVELLAQKQAELVEKAAQLNLLKIKNNLQLNWLESKLTAKLAQKKEQLAAELAQKQEQLAAELAQKQEQLAAELAQKQEQIAADLEAKLAYEFKELRDLTTFSIILNAHSR